MALVILFGLLSSTALDAFVVPALYRTFGALRETRYPSRRVSVEG